MTIIGSASVEIRADDKKFEADVQKATDKIKEMVVKLKLELEEGEAKAKLDELRAQLEESDGIKIKVKVDLEEARLQMDEFFMKYEEKHIDIKTKADTEEASLKIDELARDRTSTIKVKVDSAGADLQKAASAATGGGGGGAGQQNGLLTQVMAFEHIITLGTLAINGVGALADSFVSLAGVVMSVGQNVAQVIGLAAAAPAAFGSLITIVGTAKALFTGFGGAITGNAQALAALPPSAQKAALAVGTLKDSLLLPMQHTFWDYLDGTFQNTIKITLPALKDGLNGVSLNLAHFVDDALFKFQNMAKDGTLSGMFNNLNGMLDGLEKAFHPFLDAFVTLGAVGSSYLPRFGEWVDALSTKFGNFIKNAADTGKINVWMDTAIAQLKNVWGVADGALGILKGLTLAFDKVPTLSLGGLSDELKSLSTVMQGPAFQQDASQIFGGMVQGSIQMRKAFTDMFKDIGNNSQVFGAELSAMGGLVAALIHGVMDLFTPKLTEGLINSTKSLTSTVEGLKPTFQDLGNIIGNLLELVDGALNKSVPAINTVAKIVDTVISNLKDGVGGAIPVLATFINTLLNGLAPILDVASKLLGGILTFFDGLPRPIQDTTAALALLIGLKYTVLSGFFDKLKSSAKPALDDTAAAASRASGAIDATATAAANAINPARDLGGALAELHPPRFDPNDGKDMLRFLDTTRMSAGDVRTAYINMGASFQEAHMAEQRALSNSTQDVQSYRDAMADAAARLENENRTIAQSVFDATGQVTRGYEDMAGASANSATHVEESTGRVRGYVSGLSTSVQGVRTAWTGLADTIRGRGVDLEEGGTRASAMRDSFGNLRTSIGEVTQKSGVAGALSGLVGFLGGPWGIAITGAMVALDAFGAAQQDAAAKVDALSKTLDAQGHISQATKTTTASNLVDDPKDTAGAAMRGINSFMSGDIMQGVAKSTSEFAASIGTSLSEITDKLTDPKGGDAYRANWDKIKSNMEASGTVSESLAASVGLTAKQIEDAGAPSVAHFVDKLDSAKTALTDAQVKVKELADATGLNSGKAEILSSNYDVLASQTSTVSDKFNALKTNLDLVNDSQLSLMDGQEAYGKTVSSTSTALQQLSKDNNGQVKDLVSLSGQFDFTKAASAQMYDTIKSAKDGILQVGASVLDDAIAHGKSGVEAQQIALNAMQKPIADLQTTLHNIGLSQPQIDSVIKEMGLVPEKLETAIGVKGTEQAKRDIADVAISAQAFATGNWTGALAMLPDDALKAISEAVGAGDAYKTHDYTAILAAANKTGPGIAGVLADVYKAVNGDYAASLKADNVTALGIQQAKSAIDTQITNGEFVGKIFVRSDEASLNYTKSQIFGVTNLDYTATIRVVADAASVKSAADYIQANSPATGVPAGHYADGGILGGNGIRSFANGGLFDNIRAFANGAENHVAQIAQGQWPLRVWAEPETGGEAYIPLSPTKRNRSENILGTVADQFGFNLVKKFDSGGLLTQNDTQQPYVAASSNHAILAPAPQIHVHPSAGLDEKAIGVAALHELNFQIQHGV